MNSVARAAIVLLLLSVPFLTGCFPWATKGEHQLKIVAPPSVAAGGIYTFRVEVTDLGGQPLRNMHYGWMIDWPDVRGITHTGLSFEPESMAVKGGPGKALLRVYVQDEKGRMVQVDKFEFKVE